MSIPLLQVDAFAERPFAGNPAAVVLLEAEADAGWMQAVAQEMNLSETAFLHPAGDEWGLRWFTPAAEVELCGHATLASAHALWETGRAETSRPLRFRTRFRGELACVREDDGRIAMDFPAEEVHEETPPAGLAEALGVRALRAGRTRYDWLIEAGSEAAVVEARPDFAAVARFEARGVCLTARAERPGIDFVSRFFAPRLRIAEDPVTGSAHCALGPWWRERLGRDTLEAFQASARGGAVRVRCRGDRVELAGRAVTVLTGTLLA